VDRGNLIIGKNLHRRERIAQMTVRAGAIDDRVADFGAGLSTPAASANRFFRLSQVLLKLRASSNYREIAACGRGRRSDAL
jgi:hypothetical protein